LLATSESLAACRVDLSTATGMRDLATVLALRGVALIDGICDQQALHSLAGRLGEVVWHRDSDASGATVITNRNSIPAQPGRAGFTDQALPPHTDGSDRRQPPHLVVMACAQPAEHGGECLILDGQAVHTELAATAPDALTDLAAPRSAYFGGAAGYVGSVFELQPDGHVGLRLRLDELARFSPRTQRWLPALRQAIDRHTITLTPMAGSGYVLNNRRWLHGRYAFTGQRMMRRVHIAPWLDWHIPTGFPPIGARQ
jgi:hypothetical protein